MSNNQRIKKIEKELVKLSLIDAIPMLMIGLGLYAKYSESNETFFEILKNESIVNGLLIISKLVIFRNMFKS